MLVERWARVIAIATASVALIAGWRRNPRTTGAPPNRFVEAVTAIGSTIASAGRENLRR